MELLGGTALAALSMGVAALVIGYSKTALGGLAVVSVAIFASVLPARQSTGAILAVLIVGDLVAVWHYRRDADWAIVRRLLPAVLPGLVLGSVFLGLVDDTVLRRSIGGILLALVLLQLWVKWRSGEEASTVHERRAASWAAGTAAGFATMTANAAGAVMTLYLSASGIDKRRFVGTNAWFFLIVNLVKVPFSVGLGLLHWRDAGRAGLLAPLVLLGGVLGYATVRRISQRGFDVAVLLASAVAAAALLLG
ncbi:sulfite exporter TauE/SafE family protein [Phycicoccus sp. HDW14]|uniref:sulfite exporter TauE/SafE family protein n=1 Tax=Phycicoccus sp. HDW14 TaxID=2714941 RepID=UPI001F1043B5|nr:sulfite exporter TauE/SafE family protein [Phycicoccus sp. HDW14]